MDIADIHLQTTEQSSLIHNSQNISNSTETKTDDSKELLQQCEAVCKNTDQKFKQLLVLRLSLKHEVEDLTNDLYHFYDISKEDLDAEDSFDLINKPKRCILTSRFKPFYKFLDDCEENANPNQEESYTEHLKILLNELSAFLKGCADIKETYSRDIEFIYKVGGLSIITRPYFYPEDFATLESKLKKNLVYHVNRIIGNLNELVLEENSPESELRKKFLDEIKIYFTAPSFDSCTEIKKLDTLRPKRDVDDQTNEETLDSKQHYYISGNDGEIVYFPALPNAPYEDSVVGNLEYNDKVHMIMSEAYFTDLSCGVFFITITLLAAISGCIFGFLYWLHFRVKGPRHSGRFREI